ncbi:helix-turn-helix transcriptional regulator [Bacillus sp. SD088]|uniref:helix-turn-helix transcriptional regulator n=1 Tax=Bacillus sp. SD088 TaxID=2782012 RepID=UPI001A969646|nr:AraC family transcriptional regulator [Bacillus sp. SD088]MBO0993916.1 helix-turn-helix transcriptional regulator [Bacillus sp. SD088]
MSYQPIIQKSIKYIENNLHEDLSLESIAQFAGFSRYHFHRVFQKETGVTISEYVRYRRIANSASMLINADEKIIDIAFYYHFETQESFSRSFKKHYKLPPGQYRKIMGQLMLQREETVLKNEQRLKGWLLSGSHPANYRMGIDRKIFHKGKGSGFLKSSTVQSNDEFATMMQQFKANKYLGKRIKLSGFLKSQSIEGYCGFWLRVDNTIGDVLQFDNMSDRPIIGSTEWNHYYIVLDVPQNTSLISFGVLLSGKGQVWVDEFKFEEVDKKTPTTNIDFTSDILDEPTNLSFEE